MKKVTAVATATRTNNLKKVNGTRTAATVKSIQNAKITPAAKDKSKSPETAPAKKAAALPPATTQQTAAPEQPKTKLEIKKGLGPVNNLESTLKVVGSLHRRMVQRDNLIIATKNLETFELKQKQDEEIESGSYYNGCILTLEDDDRRKFSTKNPVIIRAAVDFLKGLFETKLMEVEAEIVLP